jgi:hypothetical protein
MKKQIGEHLIDIPEWRPGMELINEGLPPEECKWSRIKFPNIFYDINESTVTFASITQYDSNKKLITLSVEDSITVMNLVKKDIYRRINGVHIKIKDRIEWLCPDYYFFLQWFQQKDMQTSKDGTKYGNCRWIQNTILQLWNHAKHDEDIAGLALPKIKKSGITYLFVGAFLNEMLTTRNNDFLAMSKDPDTAKLSIFSFMDFAIRNLPWILRPALSVESKTEIKLSRPRDKKRQWNKTGKYLGSLFKITKTKEAAFDGPVPFRCWIDEFPKTWKASHVSPKKIFDKSVEAVKVNQKIRGKILLTSYMPEEADQGYYEAKKICEQSLLSTIKPGNKRTESNLIIFPLYADMSNEQAFDEFGDCDPVLARKIVIQSRSEKTDTVDLIANRRQYPLTWGDMFDNTGAGSAFDNKRLVPILNRLKSLSDKGLIDYVPGYLRWSNSAHEIGLRPIGEFSEVYFEPLTFEQIEKGEKAPFKLFIPHNSRIITEIENRAFKANKRDQNGYLIPLDSFPGVFSIDPTDYKLKSDVKIFSHNGSYGGFIPDLRLNELEANVSDMPIFEYHYRDENPDVTMEDFIKLCIWTGFYAIIEGNKGWLYTEFKKHKLTNFLLVKQRNGAITPWQIYQEHNGGNKIINTDEAMITIYMRAISRFIIPPKSEDEFDKMDNIKTYELVSQLVEFDATDTRRYDLAVAFGYWRVGIESMVMWLYNKSIQTNNINMLDLITAESLFTD